MCEKKLKHEDVEGALKEIISKGFTLTEEFKNAFILESEHILFSIGWDANRGCDVSFTTRRKPLCEIENFDLSIVYKILNIPDDPNQRVNFASPNSEEIISFLESVSSKLCKYGDRLFSNSSKFFEDLQVEQQRIVDEYNLNIKLEIARNESGKA